MATECTYELVMSLFTIYSISPKFFYCAITNFDN